LASGAEDTTTTSAPSSAPEPRPDPAAELKNAIKDKLGDSNRDVHRVTVKAAAKAGKPINVKVAIDDNLTGNLVRIGARKDVVDILMVVQEDADWKYSDVVVGQSRTLCRLPLVGPPSRTYERGAEASTCNSRTNLQLQRSGGC
jgi:hypothetical protein